MRSSIAESALRQIWKNLQVIEAEGTPPEVRRELQRHSGGSVSLSDKILEVAKRTFYTAWEAVDSQAYKERTWQDDETWSGWELPRSLPSLRRRVWQALAMRLAEALPSNEQLEHWGQRLFWVGFNAMRIRPEGDARDGHHLVLAVQLRWHMT